MVPMKAFRCLILIKRSVYVQKMNSNTAQTIIKCLVDFYEYTFLLKCFLAP